MRKLLWDDPLLGIYWKNCQLDNPDFWVGTLKEYAGIRRQLSDCKKGEAGDISHALLIVELLEKKIDLKIKLERAYFKHNKKELGKVRELIPDVIDSVDKLLSSFRKNWYLRNKPFGFEVIQIRLAGQKERFREIDYRLAEYLAGRIDSIPELEEKTSKAGIGLRYSSLAIGSVGI